MNKSNPRDSRQSERNTPEESTTVQPPSKPAGFLNGTQGKFAIESLPEFQDFKKRNVKDWMDYEHQDTRAITANVSADTIKITVPEMKLNRAITVKALFNTKDGTVQERSTRVTPKSNNFQKYTPTIDISNTTLPKLSEGRVEIIVKDTHPGANTPRSLKPHRYMAFPYETSNGEAVYYLNDDRLNHQIVATDTAPLSSLHNSTEAVFHNVETEKGRTIFAALTYSDEFNRDSDVLIGGRTTIPKSKTKDWDGYSEYDETNHPLTYIYQADNTDFITQWANSTATTLDNAGIESKFNRLQAVANLIQHFKYERDTMYDPQYITLYHTTGNCSEVTWLYMATLNTAPYDYTRTCSVMAQIGDIWHELPAIDLRDIPEKELPDRNMRTTKPTKEHLELGFPDTKYILVEMTNPYKIGKFNGELRGITATSRLVSDKVKKFRTFG